MKIAPVTIAAAAIALLGATAAEAGPRHGGGYGHGGSHSAWSHHGGHGYVASGHHHHHHHAPVPVYKTHTVEVNRHSHCRTRYDHCGRPYTYHVTVVTYCDHYSNGTSRTWTRTFS